MNIEDIQKRAKECRYVDYQSNADVRFLLQEIEKLQQDNERLRSQLPKKLCYFCGGETSRKTFRGNDIHNKNIVCNVCDTCDGPDLVKNET